LIKLDQNGLYVLFRSWSVLFLYQTCVLAKKKPVFFSIPQELSPIYKFLDIHNHHHIKLFCISIVFWARVHPHFILLCSSYIIIIICIPHPPKKKPLTLNKEETKKQKKMVLAAIIIKSLFSFEKKAPPPPFPYYNIHFCHDYLYKNL
jgi:hypothetical protein